IFENYVIVYALLEKIRVTGIENFANQKIHKIQRNGNTEKLFLQSIIPDSCSDGSSQNCDDKYLSIETSLIIVADGANSFIRDYFNFETKVKPYKHTA
ncbi:2-octaprenyl-3-methyl-6-methoxy-1,4-benzoquinol hydroxylase, partial [Francisella tularensis subsp. holarctica]|nr:2-octaprenyl-3-methyl-6-methoxy-1,4-benzoquinol hydroxylase [Francisella tularensis subsp. holarctica]